MAWHGVIYNRPSIHSSARLTDLTDLADWPGPFLIKYSTDPTTKFVSLPFLIKVYSIESILVLDPYYLFPLAHLSLSSFSSLFPSFFVFPDSRSPSLLFSFLILLPFLLSFHFIYTFSTFSLSLFTLLSPLFSLSTLLSPLFSLLSPLPLTSPSPPCHLPLTPTPTPQPCHLHSTQP